MMTAIFSEISLRDHKRRPHQLWRQQFRDPSHRAQYPDECNVQQWLANCGIEALYEPYAFAFWRTSTSAKRQVKRVGFCPDFYLPEYKLFIEVTASRSLRIKHRKVACFLGFGIPIFLLDVEWLKIIEKEPAKIGDLVLLIEQVAKSFLVREEDIVDLDQLSYQVAA